MNIQRYTKNFIINSIIIITQPKKNNYAFKTFKNFGKGNKYGEEDGDGDGNLDFLSPSQFLYYNNNKKEY